MSIRVAVALSGGADSLYSLIKLQKTGVPVIGVHGYFAQRLPFGSSQEQAQRLEEALLVAERLEQVCNKLGVPLLFYDGTEAFMREVVTPFVRTYAAGKTPNPCALCNASIKFGALLDYCKVQGATFLATGHYAQILYSKRAQELFSPYRFDWLHQDVDSCSNPILIQGEDTFKDQSYFLSLIPKHDLDSILFPLGREQKQDVLETLARRALSVPARKESQEVCFVPHDEYRDFLPQLAEQLGIQLGDPGPMLLEDGQRIGTHRGLWQYTEGQRKGLGVGWKEPLYVLGKEQQGNILRLGPHGAMRQEECLCPNVNLLLEPGAWGSELLVKTRYREKPKRAEVFLEPNGASFAMRIKFAEVTTAIAAGQIAAVYIPFQGGERLGGKPILQLVAGGIIAG